MNSLDEQLKLIQARIDGEVVLGNSTQHLDNEFVIDETHKFNFALYTYRIKPREPRVIWVNEYAGYFGDSYDHESDAKDFAEGNCIGQVEFREVIKDE